MSDVIIPALYCKSTTVIVDDNTAFIEYIQKRIRKIGLCQIFDNPSDALAYFPEKFKGNLMLGQSLQIDPSELHVRGDYKFNLNLADLYKEIYNPDRFLETTVLVLDYYMAGMNGLELAKKLKNFPCKKILITADSEHHFATNALNEREIDKFIVKNDPDFEDKLCQSIIQMQMEYFYDLSKLIIYPMMHDANSALSYKIFQDFFTKFRQDHNIAEFYLIDPTGSMLLINSEGKVSWLLIKNDADMEAYIDLATDSNAADSIIEKLMLRQLLPYFIDQHEIATVDSKNWDNYLYPAQSIAGLNAFYYSYVTDKMIIPIDTNKIVSYSQYLEKSKRK